MGNLSQARLADSAEMERALLRPAKILASSKACCNVEVSENWIERVSRYWRRVIRLQRNSSWEGTLRLRSSSLSFGKKRAWFCFLANWVSIKY